MKLREIGIILRNVILGGNIDLVTSLFTNPRRAVAYATECRFLKRCMLPKCDLPQRNVWEVLGAERVDVTFYATGAVGWFCDVASFTADLVAMCMLCRILKPKIIFEIGTFRGAGALHWAGNAPDAEVYTPDLPSNYKPSLPLTTTDRMHIKIHAETSQLAFVGAPEKSRIHPLYGDSAAFDFSSFFRRVDLFFIDGSHSYDYVRNDTLKALECCHSGSVIAWHDYGRVGFNGVSKLLHEFSAKGHRIYRIPGGSLAFHQVS